MIHDRTLIEPRLSNVTAVTVPTRVIWGTADRIVDPEYGRAFAQAIPGADFLLLPGTGHLPQLETPADLVTPVSELAGRNARGRTPRSK